MLQWCSGSPQDRGTCYGGGSAGRAEDPTNPRVGEDGRSPAQGGSHHAAHGHGDGQQRIRRTCRPSCSKATAARSSCVPLGGAKSLLLYSTPPLLPAFYLRWPVFLRAQRLHFFSRAFSMLPRVLQTEPDSCRVISNFPVFFKATMIHFHLVLQEN